MFTEHSKENENHRNDKDEQKWWFSYEMSLSKSTRATH